MTSAKISGMVSTPGTLDTGLSKVTGTVEKGLCSNNHTAGSCSRQRKETECKGEFSYTESGRAAESTGRHKGCI